MRTDPRAALRRCRTLSEWLDAVEASVDVEVDELLGATAAWGGDANVQVVLDTLRSLAILAWESRNGQSGSSADTTRQMRRQPQQGA